MNAQYGPSISWIWLLLLFCLVIKILNSCFKPWFGGLTNRHSSNTTSKKQRKSRSGLSIGPTIRLRGGHFNDDDSYGGVAETRSSLVFPSPVLLLYYGVQCVMIIIS